jgi:ribosomal protein S27E
VTEKRSGRRLYVCQDCKRKQLIHWIEFNRAGRVRCNGCGSTQLEAVSGDAKQEACEKQAIRVGGGTRSTTTPLPNPVNRRKVA